MKGLSALQTVRSSVHVEGTVTTEAQMRRFSFEGELPLHACASSPPCNRTERLGESRADQQRHVNVWVSPHQHLHRADGRRWCQQDDGEDDGEEDIADGEEEDAEAEAEGDSEEEVRVPAIAGSRCRCRCRCFRPACAVLRPYPHAIDVVCYSLSMCYQLLWLPFGTRASSSSPFPVAARQPSCWQNRSTF